MNPCQSAARLTRRGLLAAAVALGVAPAGSTAAETKPAPHSAQSFLGAEAVAILKGATRVEVFRIEPMMPPKYAGRTIEGFPVISQGKDQGAAFAARLRAILLDDGTYSFDSAKGCIFSPGVVFRFGDGSGSVDIITCYQCSEFKIVAKDARGAVVRKVGEDFDNARPALVKLARDAFPDDKAIQALNDRGE